MAEQEIVKRKEETPVECPGREPSEIKKMALHPY